MGGPRLQRDIAYGVFLVSAIGVLVVRGLSGLPLGTGAAGGVGLLVALPLYVLGLVSMVVGTGLALAIRRDHGLLVLAVLAVAYLANFLLEFVPLPQRNAVPLVYGAIVIAVSSWWFMRSRRGVTE